MSRFRLPFLAALLLIAAFFVAVKGLPYGDFTARAWQINPYTGEFITLPNEMNNPPIVIENPNIFFLGWIDNNDDGLSDDLDNLNLFTLDGQPVADLNGDVELYDIDGETIVVVILRERVYYLVIIRDGETVEIPLPSLEFETLQINPDNVLLSANNNSNNPPSIFIFNFDSPEDFEQRTLDRGNTWVGFSADGVFAFAFTPVSNLMRLYNLTTGGEPLSFPINGRPAGQPAWSPNAGIVYLPIVGEDDEVALFLIDVTTIGTSLILLPGYSNWDNPIAEWSPSGAYITVANGEDDPLLIVNPADGTVITLEEGAWPMGWSDDEAYLLVWNDGEMSIVDVATGESQPLNFDGEPLSVSWRPGGSELAVLLETDEGYSVVLVNPDGTTTTIMESDDPVFADALLRWNADGTQVYLTVITDDPLANLAGAGSLVYVLDAATGELTPLDLGDLTLAG